MLKNKNLNQRTHTKWNSGFNNLFQMELSRWFTKKVFLIRLLLWSSFSNGMAVLIWLQSTNVKTEALMVFGIFAGLTSSIGITIVMQESIIGEFKSGIASWILSKPISRDSYILAKWLGNTIGAIISMIIIPTGIFYGLFFLFTGEMLNLGTFFAVVGVLSLNMLFFLSFTLLMGSFQRNSSLVIGVPIAFYLIQQILVNASNFLVEIVPWVLTNPLGDGTPSIIVSILMNTQPFSIQPIIIAILSIIIFLVLTIKIMRTQEIQESY